MTPKKSCGKFKTRTVIVVRYFANWAAMAHSGASGQARRAASLALRAALALLDQHSDGRERKPP
jgi:hypothetical protein